MQNISKNTDDLNSSNDDVVNDDVVNDDNLNDLEKIMNENNSLNNSLIEERKKSEEHMNKFLYLQADFENYKKRMLKESSDINNNAQIRSMAKFIDLKSNLALAIDQIPDNDSFIKLNNGLKMILKKTENVLKDEGLSEINCIGKPFDPNFHEVVNSVWDENATEDIIKSEIKKGYIFKGKVIQASMVEIYRKPKLPEKKC